PALPHTIQHALLRRGSGPHRSGQAIEKRGNLKRRRLRGLSPAGVSELCRSRLAEELMANLLWLQGGACSGNTMSFLNAEEPSACDLVTDFGINILWHPSLGMELGDNLQNMLRALVTGQLPLDILVFEGTVVNAPNGTGQWNRFAGRAMKDWVRDLARVASFV